MTRCRRVGRECAAGDDVAAFVVVDWHRDLPDTREVASTELRCRSGEADEECLTLMRDLRSSATSRASLVGAVRRVCMSVRPWRDLAATGEGPSPQHAFTPVASRRDVALGDPLVCPETHNPKEEAT